MVAFFSLSDLSFQRTIAPFYSTRVEQGVKLFKWCKSDSSGRPDQFLLLSQDCTLYVGSCTHPLTVVADSVEAADWAPHSAVLCYSLGDRLQFRCVGPGGHACTMQVAHPQGTAGLAASLAGLRWAFRTPWPL